MSDLNSQNPQAEKWYIGQNGQQIGPFSYYEVIMKLKNGEAALSDLCWKKGMQSWIPLGSEPSFTEGIQSIGAPPADSDKFASGVKKAKEIASNISGTAGKTFKDLTSDENIQKAKDKFRNFTQDENVRKVTESSKTAAKNSFEAFKKFILNPMGGLKVAYEHLGKRNAMITGFVFIAIYELMIYISMKSAIGKYAADMPPEIKDAIFAWKTFIVLVIPPVGMFLAYTVVRMFSKSKETFHADIFISGSFFLIIGLIVFLGMLVGFENFEAIFLLIIFGLCYQILLLYSGLNRIHCLSETSSTFCVPVILLACAWITKVMLFKFYISQDVLKVMGKM